MEIAIGIMFSLLLAGVVLVLTRDFHRERKAFRGKGGNTFS